MLLFQMFFQKGYIIKCLVCFACFATHFNKAFVLFEFLKLFFSLFPAMEHISEVGVRQYLSFIGSEFVKLLRNHDLLREML